MKCLCKVFNSVQQIFTHKHCSSSSFIVTLSLIRHTARARTQFSGCNSTTNAHSEMRQMAVCCQNQKLGVLSSHSALSKMVGALFKKFCLFLNMPRTHSNNRIDVGGPSSSAEHSGVQFRPLLLPEIEPLLSGSQALSLVIIMTELLTVSFNFNNTGSVHIMLHRYMRTDRQTGGLKRVNCLIMFEYTSYLTENTVSLYYRRQNSSSCLVIPFLSVAELNRIQKCLTLATYTFLVSKQVIPIVATAPETLSNCLNGNYIV